MGVEITQEPDNYYRRAASGAPYGEERIGWRLVGVGEHGVSREISVGNSPFVISAARLAMRAWVTVAEATHRAEQVAEPVEAVKAVGE